MRKHLLSKIQRGWIVFAFVILCAGWSQAQEVPPIPKEFKHPGLLNDLGELEYIKQQIKAGKEPWKSAFEKMRKSKLAALNYTPHPHEITSSGLGGKGAKEGGASDEGNDSKAAYTQALMWIFTGDERYAQNAVNILNAWSILREHQGGNWYLAASWTGSMFPLGAELIRATYPKWKQEDIAKFSEMLNRAFLPALHNRPAYGNREFSTCNALVAIGVFNNDRAAFAEGIAHWVSYVPAYIYLREDGPKPKTSAYLQQWPSLDDLAELDRNLFSDVKQSWIYSDIAPMMKANRLGDDRTLITKLQFSDIDKVWYNPGVYFDGLSAETCRDLGHTEMALASIINVAEIARHQGIDLYSLYRKRITAFIEFTAGLRLGQPVPPELHGGKLDGKGIFPTYEIAYNQYHNVMGDDLPNTQKLIETVIRLSKAEGYSVPQPPIFADRVWGQAFLHCAWETLTHADLPSSASGTASPPSKNGH